MTKMATDEQARKKEYQAAIADAKKREPAAQEAAEKAAAERDRAQECLETIKPEAERLQAEADAAVAALPDVAKTKWAAAAAEAADLRQRADAFAAVLAAAKWFADNRAHNAQTLKMAADKIAGQRKRAERALEELENPSPPPGATYHFESVRRTAPRPR